MILDSSLLMLILTVNKNHGIFTVMEYPAVMTTTVVSIASSSQLKKKSESRYSRNVGNKGSWKQQDKSKPVRKNGGPVIGYKKTCVTRIKAINTKMVTG
uniref:Putative ovule protein n=1 Tax=Solanum chacoense TaxID=4108 RepID=A0A0V0GT02_SOLCH